MKAKLQNILISLMAFGAIACLSLSVIPARGAASGAVQDARQAPTGHATDGQALAGTWKLNRAQSDDPAKKLVSDDNIPLGDTGTSVPIAGQTGGPPNANPQTMGAPGGMGGIGSMGGIGPGGMGGMPSMPATPPSHRWESDKDRQKRLEGLLPADSLTILQKDNEFDFVDAQDHKQVLYTDGRKLRKSKDDKVQEFAGRSDAGHLTYDEKRPPRGTITRTFELSLDGRQMTETMTIDNGSISVPVVLKYVYDAAPATAQK